MEDKIGLQISCYKIFVEGQGYKKIKSNGAFYYFILITASWIDGTLTVKIDWLIFHILLYFYIDLHLICVLLPFMDCLPQKVWHTIFSASPVFSAELTPLWQAFHSGFNELREVWTEEWNPSPFQSHSSEVLDIIGTVSQLLQCSFGFHIFFSILCKPPALQGHF